MPNSAPMLNSVNFNSSAPTTNQILTVTASASDMDFDAITFDYVWKVNGGTVKTTAGTSSTTDTLDLSQSGNGNKGDSVQVYVTPYDPYTSGMYNFATATVANSAPIVTSPGTQESLRRAVISLQVSASDADGDTLSYSASGLPTGLSFNSSTGVISGTVSNSAMCNSAYTVHISANDGSGDVSQNIDWIIVNHAPTLIGQSFSTSHNQALYGIDLLAIAGDADGDPLQAIIACGPYHGTLTLQSNGLYDYTPLTSWTGTETISVWASDGIATSTCALFSFNVTNEAPLVIEDSTWYWQDGTTTGFTMNALEYAVDADGDSISIVSVDTPSSGSVTINGDDTLSFHPDSPLWEGTVTIQFMITDGTAQSAGVFTIALYQPANPVMRSDFIQVVLDNFDSWDAIQTGQTDGQLTRQDIDTLMGRAQLDTSIENAANAADRTAAIRRAAAIVMLKAHFDFLRDLDAPLLNNPAGINRADLNAFDPALNSTATANAAITARRRAGTVNLDFNDTVTRIRDAYDNRNQWRVVFGEMQNGQPVLGWSNVRQGRVGDCYFVAAVVGLARARSTVITNAGAIVDLADGRYRVTFPGSNPVFIDKPTYAEMAFYSTAGENGMWLTILCKAYGAKLNNDSWFHRTTNSFDAAGNGGLLTSGIGTVTGNNTTPRNGGPAGGGLFSLNSNRFYTRQQTITDVQTALNANKVITCATSADLPLLRFGPNSLPRSHAYTIIGYDAFANPGAGGTLTIRNPWGQQNALDNPFGGTFTRTMDQFRSQFRQLCFEN